MNLSSLLLQSSLRYPHHQALLDWDSKKSFSYSELEQTVSCSAHLFSIRGFQKGDRVALLLPNGFDFIIGYFALLRVGATVITINPMLKSEELAYIFKNGEIRGIVLHRDFQVEAQKGLRHLSCSVDQILVSDEEGLASLSKGHPEYYEPAMGPADEKAVLIYTSGTTGVPKGVVISNENLFYMNQACIDIYEYEEKDRVIGVLPFSHIFGQTAIVTAVLSKGGLVLFQKRFSTDTILPMIAEGRATVMMGVPTMYFYILNHSEKNKYDFSSLRLCVSGGAPMPMDIYRRLKMEMKATVMVQYGLTESGLAISNRIGSKGEKPGSVGIPAKTVEVKIADDKGNSFPPGETGELLLRGPNIIKEYYRNPEETSAALVDGWLRTGDLAFQDEEGYVTIVDRKKEMILRGGFNVYPKEVEEILYSHPKIAEAAVIGVPDPAKGEEVKAFVSLKPNELLTTEELKEFCRIKIANYKCPTFFEILPELPKGSTGKILKKLLKRNTDGSPQQFG